MWSQEWCFWLRLKWGKNKGYFRCISKKLRK
jgi:hypothetical protein